MSDRSFALEAGAEPLAGSGLADVVAKEGSQKQPIYQCHADVGGGSGVVDAVGVEGHRHLVAAGGDAESAQNVVYAAQLCGFAVDGGLPSPREPYLAEDAYAAVFGGDVVG